MSVWEYRLQISYTEKVKHTVKNFNLLVCEPYNASILASYNVLKIANYFCCFVTLFNFLSFLSCRFPFSCYSQLIGSKSCFMTCSFYFLVLMFVSGMSTFCISPILAVEYCKGPLLNNSPDA